MMKKTLSFTAGALCMLLAAMLAVSLMAVSERQFVKALLQTVPQEALGVSEEQLAAFGTETIRYLRGQKENWLPQIPVQGVSPAFREHMAQVRSCVLMVPWLAVGGLLVCVVLMLIGRSRRFFGLGMAAPLCVTALALVWAFVDFESLWMVIHRVFIPGGIFPAGEPVMQLFPLELFFAYIPVVLGLLAVLAAPAAAYAAISLIAKGQRT